MEDTRREDPSQVAKEGGRGVNLVTQAVDRAPHVTL